MDHEIIIRQLADKITYNQKQTALLYSGIIHYIYFRKKKKLYIYSASKGGYVLSTLTNTGKEQMILATKSYREMENKLNEIQKTKTK